MSDIIIECIFYYNVASLYRETEHWNPKIAAHPVINDLEITTIIFKDIHYYLKDLFYKDIQITSIAGGVLVWYMLPEGVNIVIDHFWIISIGAKPTIWKNTHTYYLHTSTCFDMVS